MVYEAYWARVRELLFQEFYAYVKPFLPLPPYLDGFGGYIYPGFSLFPFAITAIPEVQKVAIKRNPIWIHRLLKIVSPSLYYQVYGETLIEHRHGFSKELK